MSLGPEVEKGAVEFVKFVASKTGYQLSADQILDAAAKVIAGVEGALNAWPEAKKAGEAEADKVKTADDARKWQKEH